MTIKYVYPGWGCKITATIAHRCDVVTVLWRRESGELSEHLSEGAESLCVKQCNGEMRSISEWVSEWVEGEWPVVVRPILLSKRRFHFKTHKSLEKKKNKNDCAGEAQQQFTGQDCMKGYEVMGVHVTTVTSYMNGSYVVDHQCATSFFLFQYIVSILWVLIKFWCCYMACRMVYKEDSLRLTTYACYSKEMALNVGLNVSFDNVQERKGILEKTERVNSTKGYVTNDEISCWVSFPGDFMWPPWWTKWH
jgi:hypothetical protein